MKAEIALQFVEDKKMLGDNWDNDLSVKHRLLEIMKRFKTPA